MKLYVIRHAEAAPREGEWVARGEDRPLTERGQHQCQQVARGLKKAKAAPAALYHSPLLRARQTASGIRENWGANSPPLAECEALSPGSKKRRLVKVLEEGLADEMAVVGHNPDLNELVAWLMGDRGAGIDLSKAGVACLQFEGPPRKGGGTLLWMVTPAWLSER